MTTSKFKIKKRITLAVLQIKPNAGDRFFKFISPMHLGEKLDDQKNAATLLEAVDLVTGEHGQIIVPTIMQNDLNKHFPADSYVGVCFCVTVTRNAAKKYNHVSLAEIEEPEAASEAEAPKPEAEASDVSETGTVAGGDEPASNGASTGRRRR